VVNSVLPIGYNPLQIYRAVSNVLGDCGSYTTLIVHLCQQLNLFFFIVDIYLCVLYIYAMKNLRKYLIPYLKYHNISRAEFCKLIGVQRVDHLNAWLSDKSDRYPGPGFAKQIERVTDGQIKARDIINPIYRV